MAGRSTRPASATSDPSVTSGLSTDSEKNLADALKAMRNEVANVDDLLERRKQLSSWRKKLVPEEYEQSDYTLSMLLLYQDYKAEVASANAAERAYRAFKGGLNLKRMTPEQHVELRDMAKRTAQLSYSAALKRIDYLWYYPHVYGNIDSIRRHISEATNKMHSLKNALDEMEWNESQALRKAVQNTYQSSVESSNHSAGQADSPVPSVDYYGLDDGGNNGEASGAAGDGHYS